MRPMTVQPLRYIELPQDSFMRNNMLTCIQRIHKIWYNLCILDELVLEHTASALQSRKIQNRSRFGHGLHLP